MASLRVISVGPDHAIGSFGSTLLYTWGSVTRTEPIQQLVAEFGVARAEGVLLLFGVVDAEVELPSTEMRGEFAEVVREFGEQGGVASALVYEGRGFRAAAVRSLVTGVALVARQPFPHRVFATVPEAARWLASMSVGQVEADQLVEALAALRSQR